MTDLNCPRQNHLLDALPAAEYERLFPHLELVPMPLGEVLYESGDKLRYVYFPTTCIVSMLYVMENGASAEIAVVGNEGIIGVALFMGGGNHAESGRRAERGLRLSAAGTSPYAGIRPLWRTPQRDATRFVAALYPGADYPDGANGSLQSASFGGPATLPLAAAKPRPATFERVDHDPGIDCQYAGRAPRRRHGGRREIAAKRD